MSPPRAQRADAQRSREQILRAALDRFADDPRTSLADVAATAGVGRSTLHRHFHTRADLTEALSEAADGRQDTSPQAGGQGGGGLSAPVRHPPVGGQAAYLASEPTGADSAQSLRPAGQLGRVDPLALEALHILDEVPPHLVADQLVAEARRVAGVPVALYVIDIDGSGLLRLAGEEDDLPARLEVAVGLGQDIAPDSLADLYAYLESTLPGCLPFPLWLRGRATGVLLAVGTPLRSLTEIARQGAAAIELSNGYTDVFEAVRRRRATSPAAEMALNLAPSARIVRVGGGELAGVVLSSPEVGGDWFDFAENRDGSWLAIADAAGQGPVAAGRAAVSLGALRSARRQGHGLADAAEAVHRLVYDLGENFTVDAILAHWRAPVSTFSWVACGHRPPLLVSADGTVQELPGEVDLPLGCAQRTRDFSPRHRRLRRGERVVLCSDGVFGRRTEEGGRFGLAGVRDAIAAARGISAAATARSIQHAVVRAASGPLEDDTAVVVLAVT